MMVEAQSNKCGKPRRMPISPILLLLLACMLAQASFAALGDIPAEDYEEMTGKDKFEYIFDTSEQSMFISSTWEDFEKWDWAFICIFAVFVSFLLHGTIYVLGKAINAQGLQRYATSEMMQGAATAVMVIALVGLVIGAFDMVSSIFGGSITCMGELVADPLAGDMCRTEELLTAVNKQYLYAVEGFKENELAFSTTFNMMGYPVYMGSMVASIHRRAETFQYIAHTCVELMFLLTSKMFLLKYVQENMLQFFLPLGLILRTFHFTRGIGGFFIAMAIGFYFIYPTIVFILDTGFVESNSNFKMPSIITTGMCNLPMFGATSFGSAALQQVSQPGIAAGVTLSHNLAIFLSNLFTHLFYSNMVAFAATLTFIRFATTILGGEMTPFMGMISRLI